MGKQEMYLISGDELHQALKNAVLDALKEHDSRQPEKEFTLNQVASYLKVSWSTVKKYVNDGRLKTTGTGRVTEKSLREFLDQQ